MKTTLALGTLLLSCSLAVVAQQGTTPPPQSTPSTFPQDQTRQSPANPTAPTSPAAIPPDTNASGQMGRDHASDATQASSSQKTSVQGCLSQSSDGNFMIADNSGSSFQLRGDTSKLTSYVGKEVRVDGIASPSSASTAGSMSSSGSSSATASQFSVSDVHKVAETCSISTK